MKKLKWNHPDVVTLVTFQTTNTTLSLIEDGLIRKEDGDKVLKALSAMAGRILLTKEKMENE